MGFQGVAVFGTQTAIYLEMSLVDLLIVYIAFNFLEAIILWLFSYHGRFVGSKKPSGAWMDKGPGLKIRWKSFHTTLSGPPFASVYGVGPWWAWGWSRGLGCVAWPGKRGQQGQCWFLGTKKTFSGWLNEAPKIGCLPLAIISLPGVGDRGSSRAAWLGYLSFVSEGQTVT